MNKVTFSCRLRSFNFSTSSSESANVWLAPLNFDFAGAGDLSAEAEATFRRVVASSNSTAGPILFPATTFAAIRQSPHTGLAALVAARAGLYKRLRTTQLPLSPARPWTNRRQQCDAT